MSLVLKLRPVPRGYLCWSIEGELEQIKKFTDHFIHDTFSNLATAFDFEIIAEKLRILIEIPFLDDLEHEILEQKMAEKLTMFILEGRRVEKMPAGGGLSEVRVRTLLSNTLDSAVQVLRTFPGKAYGYLGNGFFMFWPDSTVDAGELESFLLEIQHQIQPFGGEVNAPGLERTCGSAEREWIRNLKANWGRLD